jgi:predicted GIY-YIG superfamily endonuclease
VITKTQNSFAEMREILYPFYYVYILHDTKTHRFYIGMTRELQPRLNEHRTGITRSTANMEIKLVYFETQPTKEMAEVREKEQKSTLRKNRRQIFRLITEFQNNIKEVTFLGSSLV